MLRNFLLDRSGGLAVVAGLLAPVLALAVGVVAEYGQLASRRGEMQAAADSGAIAAARELMLANVSDAQAKSVALGVTGNHLALKRPGGATDAITALLDKRTTITVEVEETVESLFGRLMSAPTFTLRTTATAKVIGANMKLCVLSLDPTGMRSLKLDKSAKLTASGCSVYANSTNHKGLSALQSSFLSAGSIFSAGGFEGKNGSNVSPTVLTDAPQLDDPLKSRAAPTSRGCDFGSLSPAKPYSVGANETLRPGTYCGGLTIQSGSVATLGQGVYILDGGPLLVKSQATLQGDYVSFYFKGTTSTFTFAAASTVSLSASKSGALAGILFFEDRTAPAGRLFTISSDNARKLLGTIYLPQGSLRIDANSPIADKSEYTVIVARNIEMSAGPNLVINANYYATDVPVPQGVGPTGGSVSLVK